jgi:hypothetical protein
MFSRRLKIGAAAAYPNRTGCGHRTRRRSAASTPLRESPPARRCSRCSCRKDRRVLLQQSLDLSVNGGRSAAPVPTCCGRSLSPRCRSSTAEYSNSVAPALKNRYANTSVSPGAHSCRSMTTGTAHARCVRCSLAVPANLTGAEQSHLHGAADPLRAIGRPRSSGSRARAHDFDDRRR